MSDREQTDRGTPMQPEYLIRDGSGRLRQVPAFNVRRVKKRRVVNQQRAGGMVFQETETVEGQFDAKWLWVTGGGPDSGAVDDFGRKVGQGIMHTIERSAAGVKATIRRLRPEEATILDDLDEQIAAVQAELSRLRRERAAAAKTAWSKAHVVRLADVEAKIDGAI